MFIISGTNFVLKLFCGNFNYRNRYTNFKLTQGVFYEKENRKIVEALREAGFEIKKVKIVLTEEDKQRRRDVAKFIKQLNDAHESAKNSKLWFAKYITNPA